MKRWLAVVLVLCMLMGMVPSVIAEEIELIETADAATDLLEEDAEEAVEEVVSETLAEAAEDQPEAETTAEEDDRDEAAEQSVAFAPYYGKVLETDSVLYDALEAEEPAETLDSDAVVLVVESGEKRVKVAFATRSGVEQRYMDADAVTKLSQEEQDAFMDALLGDGHEVALYNDDLDHPLAWLEPSLAAKESEESQAIEPESETEEESQATEPESETEEESQATEPEAETEEDQATEPEAESKEEDQADELETSEQDESAPEEETIETEEEQEEEAGTEEGTDTPEESTEGLEEIEELTTVDVERTGAGPTILSAGNTDYTKGAWINTLGQNVMLDANYGWFRLQASGQGFFTFEVDNTASTDAILRLSYVNGSTTRSQQLRFPKGQTTKLSTLTLASGENVYFWISDPSNIRFGPRLSTKITFTPIPGTVITSAGNTTATKGQLISSSNYKKDLLLDGNYGWFRLQASGQGYFTFDVNNTASTDAILRLSYVNGRTSRSQQLKFPKGQVTKLSTLTLASGENVYFWISDPSGRRFGPQLPTKITFTPITGVITSAGNTVAAKGQLISSSNYKKDLLLDGNYGWFRLQASEQGCFTFDVNNIASTDAILRLSYVNGSTSRSQQLKFPKGQATKLSTLMLASGENVYFWISDPSGRRFGPQLPTKITFTPIPGTVITSAGNTVAAKGQLISSSNYKKDLLLDGNYGWFRLQASGQVFFNFEVNNTASTDAILRLSYVNGRTSRSQQLKFPKGQVTKLSTMALASGENVYFWISDPSGRRFGPHLPTKITFTSVSGTAIKSAGNTVAANGQLIASSNYKESLALDGNYGWFKLKAPGAGYFTIEASNKAPMAAQLRFTYLNGTKAIASEAKSVSANSTQTIKTLSLSKDQYACFWIANSSGARFAPWLGANIQFVSTGTLAAPQGVTAAITTADGGDAKVTWKTVTGNAGYRVYYSTTSSWSSSLPYVSSAKGTTEKTLTMPEDFTSNNYYFWVVAVDDSGLLGTTSSRCTIAKRTVGVVTVSGHAASSLVSHNASSSLKISWSKPANTNGTYEYTVKGLTQAPDFYNNNQDGPVILSNSGTSATSFTISTAQLKKYPYLKIAIAAQDTNYSTNKARSWLVFGIIVVNGSVEKPVVTNVTTGTTFTASQITNYKASDGDLALTVNAKNGCGKYKVVVIALNETPNFSDSSQANRRDTSKFIDGYAYNGDISVAYYNKCVADYGGIPIALGGFSDGQYLKIAIGAYANETDSTPSAWTNIGLRITYSSKTSQSSSVVQHPTVESSHDWRRLYPTIKHLDFGKTAGTSVYKSIIDQFDVTWGVGNSSIQGWYEPFKGATYCNYFVADVGIAMGTFLPVNGNTCTKCGKPKNSSAVSSIMASGTKVEAVSSHYLWNGIKNKGLTCQCSGSTDNYSGGCSGWLNWFNDGFGKQFGWVEITQSEAVSMANKGYLTIGLDKGHTFIVYPNGGSNMRVTEAGSVVRNNSAPTYSSTHSWKYYYNKGVA